MYVPGNRGSGSSKFLTYAKREPAMIVEYGEKQKQVPLSRGGRPSRGRVSLS